MKNKFNKIKCPHCKEGVVGFTIINTYKQNPVDGSIIRAKNDVICVFCGGTGYTVGINVAAGMAGLNFKTCPNNHDKKYIHTDDEGTSYCKKCQEEKIHNIVDKTYDFIAKKVQYDNNTDLRTNLTPEEDLKILKESWNTSLLLSQRLAKADLIDDVLYWIKHDEDNAYAFTGKRVNEYFISLLEHHLKELKDKLLDYNDNERN